MVNMEKPDGADKWIVTNLDGSYHKHVKYGGSSQQQTTISDSVIRRDTPEIQEAKITANLRSEAIAKAHEENMAASKRLSESIDRLAAAIERYITGQEQEGQ
jgi:hypothetical protein